MGFFFTNRPGFYDAQSNRFLNVFQGQGVQDCDLDVVEGSVSFRSDFGSRSRECIRLDDTTRFQFRNPIPYEGTMIAIAKVDMLGGGATSRSIFPIICADNANPNLAPSWNFSYFSGAVTMRHNCTTSGVGAALGSFSHGPEQEFLFASAFDQTRRENAYILNEGSVTQGTTSLTTTSGNAMAFGGRQKAKFGDMNNDAAVSDPAMADYVDIAALLFYGGNAVRDAEADVNALYAEADKFYGLRYGS
ncbi:hypothetical protein [Sulfitobacter sp. SK025]|uniref:hypothetical protein n=1 Tax=Sulfitobacter sp. SK025 TaxID=1389011 RepID=UPI0013B40FF6|nr:hypothetical protein [Sulfitobacter sp. SK025]